jgi:hypothetical protein
MLSRCDSWAWRARKKFELLSPPSAAGVIGACLPSESVSRATISSPRTWSNNVTRGCTVTRYRLYRPACRTKITCAFAVSHTGGKATWPTARDQPSGQLTPTRRVVHEPRERGHVVASSGAHELADREGNAARGDARDCSQHFELLGLGHVSSSRRRPSGRRMQCAARGASPRSPRSRRQDTARFRAGARPRRWHQPRR